LLYMSLATLRHCKCRGLICYTMAQADDQQQQLRNCKRRGCLSGSLTALYRVMQHRIP